MSSWSKKDLTKCKLEQIGLHCFLTVLVYFQETEQSSNEGLSGAIIAVIVVAVLLIIAAVVAIVLWRCYYIKKMKTRGMSHYTVM